MRDSPREQPPSDYNRPSQPYECGKAVDGPPCPFGPLAGGRCANLAECQPQQDSSGEWMCERAPSRGGLCENGPTAEGQCGCTHSCVPRPSLRTNRGRWLRVSLLAIAGISLMVLGSDWRERVIVPGELSSHHAQVLRGERWESRCSACHAAAEKSPTEWLSLATSGQPVGPAQSSRCMSCHQQTINTEFALLAHSIDPKTLAARKSEKLPADGEQSPMIDQHKLACATCHQEHHGANHKLSFMSDARCQACHTESYSHFASDHPEFNRWPYERRTRIAFDHASHAGTHFAKKNTSFDCRSCHVADATGSEQLTLGFEQACAKCHAESINLAGKRGFDLVSLSIVDTEALADSGQDVDWPEAATGDFDGMLPPATVLLLAGDEQTLAAMRRFGSSVDLFDADPDSDDDMQAVATIAQAIRTLASDIAGDGNQAIEKRLTELGASTETAERVALSMSESLASEIETAWFKSTIGSPTVDGRWQRDDNLFRLTYQPIGHADPMLKAWLELAVSLPAGALRDSAINALGGPKSVSTCATCHTIERQSNGDLMVNWHYAQPIRGKSFTHFSHAPHTLQPELNDCTHCHQPRDKALATNELLQFVPTNFASDFVSLSKASCVECHQPKRATSQCTTCHNYHVR